MITFDGITVTFGTFTALPKFDLTIDEGEFFTFLGPSGCGKTTALRTLAGFVDPAAGRIRIADEDVTDLPSAKRHIGMVFQNYALFPSMSVRDNIAFGLKVARMSKEEIDAAVGEIADQVNLTPEQLGKGVAELSGGQQQRVAIARALVMKPKILLLDEPLSNLDAKLRHQLRLQLKDLQAQFGITTVYVTHDQDEALSMSDRIAVINRGQIEQVGTPQEIYTHSATEFVCTFIGDVNKLEPDESRQLVSAVPGIDPALPAYVRVEKVALLPETDSPGIPIRFDGEITAKRYHGVHTNYRVRVGSSEMNAVILDTGSAPTFAVGDRASVTFPESAIRQYPEVAA